MIQENVPIDKLLLYITSNEVVFQTFGGLINVSNNKEKENKDELVSMVKQAVQVDAYKKNDAFVSEDFADLNDWATDDDVLFLLTPIGVLICIPMSMSLSNGLIAI